MDHRNIRRYFVVNKALRLYAKDSGEVFKPSEVVTLLVISIHCGISFLDLRKYLISFHRSFPPDVLYGYLKRFEDEGMIRKDGSRFYITAYGYNKLTVIDDKVRETRIDK